MLYIFSLVLSFVLVVLTVPLLHKWAMDIDFVDKPTERKKHKVPVPLVGGLAMFISFMLSSFVFLRPFDSKSVAIMIGSLLIISIGMIDDWYKTRGKEFKVFPRLCIQILAAIIIYISGIRFNGFTNPINDTYVLLPNWLQFFMSIMWIFGVTTVMNFIDGMDGLAGSMSVISGITLFIAAIFKEQYFSAMMAITLVGAALGFLKYNLFPAKIFMGDSGANFLGFMLAVISLHGAFKQATVISVFIPVLALGVPIFDNIFVVIKRVLSGKPAYKADTSQIQFRLLSSGLNPKQVLMFLCLISACLNLTSIIILLLKI